LKFGNRGGSFGLGGGGLGGQIGGGNVGGVTGLGIVIILLFCVVKRANSSICILNDLS
jgi:hypothetical protein